MNGSNQDSSDGSDENKDKQNVPAKKEDTDGNDTISEEESEEEEHEENMQKQLERRSALEMRASEK